MLRTFLCACAVSLLFLPTIQAGEGDVFFRQVDVFDGENKFAGVNVMVVGGVIQAIGPSVENTNDAGEISGEGKTLLPGFIDAHTHAFIAGQLEQAIRFGVTTELDMLCEVASARMLRLGRDDASQDLKRADYYSAGAAVTVPGGHGTQFGFATPTLDKEDNTASFVRDRVREGSDYIKLIHEDGSAYGEETPTLSATQLADASGAAHEFGKLAVAHVSTREGAEMAIRSRVDGLVHLFVDAAVTAEMVETMKHQGVFVVPTASVIANLYAKSSAAMITDHETIKQSLTAADRRNLTSQYPLAKSKPEVIERLRGNIKMLHDGGVRILAGTDAPNPGTIHGASIHHEMQWLVMAGLTPSEALVSATSLPAKCFNLEGRGRIAAGMRADLVMVAGDPTLDIRNTMNLEGVWKNGRPIDLDSFRRKVASSNKQAASRKMASSGNESGDLPISNFDDKTTASSFGAGWMVSTDRLMGGSSTSEMKVVAVGASQSSHSLEVSGKCQVGQPCFAGVMFSPGDIPMQPKSLGYDMTLSFWSKGSGTNQSVMLFSKKRGFQPSVKKFKADTNWTRYQFKIRDFDDCDGTDVLGIWFGNESTGPYKFQIDEVQLSKN